MALHTQDTEEEVVAAATRKGRKGGRSGGEFMNAMMVFTGWGPLGRHRYVRR
ncbi:MAG: hypothetical protein K2K97_12370 [Muribaculaceae bacterium]|nr:hypothetical protein [Muribaculaceae bacterium]